MKSMGSERIILDHLTFLYGKETSLSLWRHLRPKLEKFQYRNPQFQRNTGNLTENDVILITYADQIREPNKPPLVSLAEFLEKHLIDVFSGVHLLPFYPYSSDDGFSVINYREVDPDLGTWEHVSRIGQNFRIMFDAVVNHISSKSEWFLSFLQDQVPYSDFFITIDPSTDFSKVIRPRDLPLLTPFETVKGIRHVWTTFSGDQVDLNYANPDVLLEMIDVFLFYIEYGAEIIRLDAIAYLWKEIGTSCLHLPQTHRMVKLFRSILELVAPGVLLITETNVPNKENISYFGEPVNKTQKYDEAHLVYQFTLPPLVLHAFLTGRADSLSRWAATVKTPSPSTTFFNFIASHDGIGLIPAQGFLSENEKKGIAERTLSHDGQLTYRSNPDGSRSVYELNITLFDALNDPSHPDPNLDIPRYLASQVILLSLAGVPGIYIHSLFGSHNNHLGVKESGIFRSINREKFSRSTLEAELADSNSVKYNIFSLFRHLLNQRKNHPAFHPNSEQRILFLDDALFSLIRIASSGEILLCIVNVSPRRIELNIRPGEWNLPDTDKWRDLIAEIDYPIFGKSLSLIVYPYQALWLQTEP